MDSFAAVYRQLNTAQKQAVDAIDGPVLVIAGPGTGKTQLLTARIANILQKTDTAPENILCLTFTDSAAQTMRERLSSIVGQAAYGVTISTYHAFGSELMRRYNQYFNEQPGQTAIDDLGIDTTLRTIISQLPYGNPLKFADNYISDVRSTLSDFKRALLTPSDVLTIADANDQFAAFANQAIQDQLATVSRIDKKSVTAFEQLATQTASYVGTTVTTVLSVAENWQQDLEQALAAVAETGKTTSLTAWKNRWLAKTADGQFVVGAAAQSQRLRAIANVYETYNQTLAAQNLYDYDDMILRAIRGLAANPELRYTLQEQYLYLLLDEFQDTNGAQFKLVELLTDSPVHEGRPNVLAVGDDDQAIYAFQGADYSHMLAFQQRYRDVLVVPLTENYRSSPAILQLADGVARQISQRLQTYIPSIDKTLTAANHDLPAATIARLEFKSDVGQYAWVAQQIKQLVEQGMAPQAIAVIAPQHRYLEPQVAYLQQLELPVRYDKRENVLDDPLIMQLTQLSRLVLALAEADHTTASSLWPEILSYDFWQLPTELIWQLSWQANDDRHDWTNTLLANDATKVISLFLIRLSQLVATDTLETILDYLIGVNPVEIIDTNPTSYQSPFYRYYFADSTSQAVTTTFWDLLSNLTVLRAHLRGYQTGDLLPLGLADLMRFITAHRAADIKIINTSPYQEATNAVQLMTAYKAKGQEFQAVFVLACLDEVWGTKSRTQTSNIALPANLQHIRYAGATNDERLRLFYVALTRAKTNLYLTSYTNSFSGRPTNRLSYLVEQVEPDQTIVSPLLPTESALVQTIDMTAPPLAALSANWQQRHLRPASLTVAALLENRLATYQLSPTDVNSFTDLIYAGPAAFFLQKVLKFPSAPTPEGQYGNAFHETLEWVNKQVHAGQPIPTTAVVIDYFDRQLRLKRLSSQATAQLLERGRLGLTAYLAQRQSVIQPTNESEYRFRNEAVFIGEAHLTGKIDKLMIDPTKRTITIVDYKTGKAHSRWLNDPKLHKYRQQLYLYKSLVEKSRRFKGYTVVDAYLEFVEPNEQGMIEELHLSFDAAEAAQIEQLAVTVWQHVKHLAFPGTSQFSADFKGITAFEQALLAGDI